MKLTATSKAKFLSSLDARYPVTRSVIGRYRNLLQLFADPSTDQRFKNVLLECSVLEGTRIITLLTYKGVSIDVMDETSFMATNSLKSIDGCLNAALCKMDGTKRIVFESGGNTGSALARYGKVAGLETFFFCPTENLDLLDSRLFDGKLNHLVVVEERHHVKEFAKIFADVTGIRHMPEKNWRYVAAMFRGFAILEALLQGNHYDWISQTVSAGFGPVGIYRVLEEFKSEMGALPRFLGLQQEANCPLFRALKPGQVKTLRSRSSESGGQLLTRVMYDRSPQTYDTYEDVRGLLARTAGELLTINASEFEAGVVADNGALVEALRQKKIEITRRENEILEKTGMISLVGTLKAIDAKVIAPGSRLLVLLTSGVSHADGLAQPEAVVHSSGEIREYANRIKGIE